MEERGVREREEGEKDAGEGREVKEGDRRKGEKRERKKEGGSYWDHLLTTFSNYS